MSQARGDWGHRMTLINAMWFPGLDPIREKGY